MHSPVVSAIKQRPISFRESEGSSPGAGARMAWARPYVCVAGCGGKGALEKTIVFEGGRSCMFPSHVRMCTTLGVLCIADQYPGSVLLQVGMGPTESLPKSLSWLAGLAQQLPMRRRFEVRVHIFQVGVPAHAQAVALGCERASRLMRSACRPLMTILGLEC
jgi:hypothetical protein